jgi:hypothetical protein
MPCEGKAHRPPDPGTPSGRHTCSSWYSSVLRFDTGVTNAGGAGLNDHQRGPEHSGNLDAERIGPTHADASRRSSRPPAPRRDMTCLLAAPASLWRCFGATWSRRSASSTMAALCMWWSSPVRCIPVGMLGRVVVRSPARLDAGPSRRRPMSPRVHLGGGRPFGRRGYVAPILAWPGGPGLVRRQIRSVWWRCAPPLGAGGTVLVCHPP